jgi:RNA-directed DNA polymerase
MDSINEYDPIAEKVQFGEEWFNIDWKLVNRIVVMMRRRIFKATRAKNFKLVRRLQYLMLHSSSSMAYAVRHVSYNKGSKTPGIDNRMITTPAERYEIFLEIRKTRLKDYEPSAVRRIYLKEGIKIRPIGIPTIFDRIMQMHIKSALEPEWEAKFEKSSYGFRPKRSVNDAVNRIWLTINKENCRCWVVDADISKCFDTTSHNYLLQLLEHFPARETIRKFLKCGIISSGIWFDIEEGTPQGNLLSPVLCNISLHGLESELGMTYNSQGNVNPKTCSVIRYADDIVIFTRTKKEALEKLQNLKESLAKRSQEISELKTKIVHICEGFDFVGFNFKVKPKDGRSLNVIVKEEEGYRYRYMDTGVYVTPSVKSIDKIKANLKEAFMKSKGANASKLILALNPIIRGWAQSKQHWHCNRTFHDMDHYLFNLQWRWMRRFHPNKNVSWIRNKYFMHLKYGYINNKWVFHGNDFKLKDLYMLQFKWFPPSNYIMVQIDKNPDDVNDVNYYKQLSIKRSSYKKFNLFRRMDNDLAESQFHTCPVCEQDLYNGEGVHLHHIIARKDDGKSTFSNLILLHLPCHYQSHSSEQAPRFKEIFINYKASHPNLREREKRQQKKEEKENGPNL